MHDPADYHGVLPSLKQWAFPRVVPADKKPLRKLLLKQRQNQDPRVARLKHIQIARNLLELAEVQSSHTVAAYASFRGEVDTSLIITQLLQAGKRVLLPQVVENELYFCQVCNPETDLSCVGAYGIMEPNPACCAQVAHQEIDMILAPGVGFDLFGSRLGFGGGYYDRFLQTTRRDAIILALGYDFQVQHALPQETHDVKMDGILTEKSLYQVGLSRKICLNEMETKSLARHFIEQGFEGVLALHGNLGTGKTVFVNGLAQALGTQEATTSPTFVYCREYHGKKTLYHIDAYRIDSVSDPDRDYWYEVMNQDGIVAVEWAEKLETLLPRDTVHLFGKVRPGNEREWTLFTPLRKQRALHESIC